MIIKIRKFIYRYLSLKNGHNIYKINENLKANLSIAELWEQNEELIEEKVNRIFGDLDVKVSQAFKLYEYLGGDEAQFNEMINKYNNENLNKKEKEEENERNEEDGDFEGINLNEEDKQDESNSENDEDESDNNNEGDDGGDGDDDN